MAGTAVITITGDGRLGQFVSLSRNNLWVHNVTQHNLTKHCHEREIHERIEIRLPITRAKFIGMVSVGLTPGPEDLQRTATDTEHRASDQPRDGRRGAILN